MDIRPCHVRLTRCDDPDSESSSDGEYSDNSYDPMGYESEEQHLYMDLDNGNARGKGTTKPKLSNTSGRSSKIWSQRTVLNSKSCEVKLKTPVISRQSEEREVIDSDDDYGADFIDETDESDDIDNDNDDDLGISSSDSECYVTKVYTPNKQTPHSDKPQIDQRKTITPSKVTPVDRKLDEKLRRQFGIRNCYVSFAPSGYMYEIKNYELPMLTACNNKTRSVVSEHSDDSSSLEILEDIVIDSSGPSPKKQCKSVAEKPISSLPQNYMHDKRKVARKRTTAKAKSKLRISEQLFHRTSKRSDVDSDYNGDTDILSDAATHKPTDRSASVPKSTPCKNIHNSIDVKGTEDSQESEGTNTVACLTTVNEDHRITESSFNTENVESSTAPVSKSNSDTGATTEDYLGLGNVDSSDESPPQLFPEPLCITTEFETNSIDVSMFSPPCVSDTNGNPAPGHEPSLQVSSLDLDLDDDYVDAEYGDVESDDENFDIMTETAPNSNESVPVKRTISKFSNQYHSLDDDDEDDVSQNSDDVICSNDLLNVASDNGLNVPSSNDNIDVPSEKNDTVESEAFTTNTSNTVNIPSDNCDDNVDILPQNEDTFSKNETVDKLAESGDITKTFEDINMNDVLMESESNLKLSCDDLTPTNSTKKCSVTLVKCDVLPIRKSTDKLVGDTSPTPKTTDNDVAKVRSPQISLNSLIDKLSSRVGKVASIIEEIEDINDNEEVISAKRQKTGSRIGRTLPKCLQNDWRKNSNVKIQSLGPLRHKFNKSPKRLFRKFPRKMVFGSRFPSSPTKSNLDFRNSAIVNKNKAKLPKPTIFFKDDLLERAGLLERDEPSYSSSDSGDVYRPYGPQRTKKRKKKRNKKAAERYFNVSTVQDLGDGTPGNRQCRALMRIRRAKDKHEVGEDKDYDVEHSSLRGLSADPMHTDLGDTELKLRLRAKQEFPHPVKCRNCLNMTKIDPATFACLFCNAPITLYSDPPCDPAKRTYVSKSISESRKLADEFRDDDVNCGVDYYKDEEFPCSDEKDIPRFEIRSNATSRLCFHCGSFRERDFLTCPSCTRCGFDWNVPTVSKDVDVKSIFPKWINSSRVLESSYPFMIYKKYNIIISLDNAKNTRIGRTNTMHIVLDRLVSSYNFANIKILGKKCILENSDRSSTSSSQVEETNANLSTTTAQQVSSLMPESRGDKSTCDRLSSNNKEVPANYLSQGLQARKESQKNVPPNAVSISRYSGSVRLPSLRKRTTYGNDILFDSTEKSGTNDHDTTSGNDHDTNKRKKTHKTTSKSQKMMRYSDGVIYVDMLCSDCGYYDYECPCRKPNKKKRKRKVKSVHDHTSDVSTDIQAGSDKTSHHKENIKSGKEHSKKQKIRLKLMKHAIHMSSNSTSAGSADINSNTVLINQTGTIPTSDGTTISSTAQLSSHPTISRSMGYKIQSPLNYSSRVSTISTSSTPINYTPKSPTSRYRTHSPAVTIPMPIRNLATQSPMIRPTKPPQYTAAGNPISTTGTWMPPQTMPSSNVQVPLHSTVTDDHSFSLPSTTAPGHDLHHAIPLRLPKTTLATIVSSHNTSTNPQYSTSINRQLSSEDQKILNILHRNVGGRNTTSTPSTSPQSPHSMPPVGYYQELPRTNFQVSVGESTPNISAESSIPIKPPRMSWHRPERLPRPVETPSPKPNITSQTSTTSSLGKDLRNYYSVQQCPQQQIDSPYTNASVDSQVNPPISPISTEPLVPVMNTQNQGLQTKFPSQNIPLILSDYPPIAKEPIVPNVTAKHQGLQSNIHIDSQYRDIPLKTDNTPVSKQLPIPPVNTQHRHPQTNVRVINQDFSLNITDNTAVSKQQVVSSANTWYEPPQTNVHVVNHDIPLIISDKASVSKEPQVPTENPRHQGISRAESSQVSARQAVSRKAMPVNTVQGTKETSTVDKLCQTIKDRQTPQLYYKVWQTEDTPKQKTQHKEMHAKHREALERESYAIKQFEAARGIHKQNTQATELRVNVLDRHLQQRQTYFEQRPIQPEPPQQTVSIRPKMTDTNQQRPQLFHIHPQSLLYRMPRIPVIPRPTLFTRPPSIQGMSTRPTFTVKPSLISAQTNSVRQVVSTPPTTVAANQIQTNDILMRALPTQNYGLQIRSNTANVPPNTGSNFQSVNQPNQNSGNTNFITTNNSRMGQSLSYLGSFRCATNSSNISIPTSRIIASPRVLSDCMYSTGSSADHRSPPILFNRLSNPDLRPITSIMEPAHAPTATTADESQLDFLPNEDCRSVTGDTWNVSSKYTSRDSLSAQSLNSQSTFHYLSDIPRNSPTLSARSSPHSAPRISPIDIPRNSPTFTARFSPHSGPRVSPSDIPRNSQTLTSRSSPHSGPRISPIDIPRNSPTFTVRSSPHSGPPANDETSQEFNPLIASVCSLNDLNSTNIADDIVTGLNMQNIGIEAYQGGICRSIPVVVTTTSAHRSNFDKFASNVTAKSRQSSSVCVVRPSVTKRSPNLSALLHHTAAPNTATYTNTPSPLTSQPLDERIRVTEPQPVTGIVQTREAQNQGSDNVRDDRNQEQETVISTGRDTNINLASSNSHNQDVRAGNVNVISANINEMRESEINRNHEIRTNKPYPRTTIASSNFGSHGIRHDTVYVKPKIGPQKPPKDPRMAIIQRDVQDTSSGNSEPDSVTDDDDCVIIDDLPPATIKPSEKPSIQMKREYHALKVPEVTGPLKPTSSIQHTPITVTGGTQIHAPSTDDGSSEDIIEILDDINALSDYFLDANSNI